ncbi:MAG TPA: hypothetical protein VEY91_00270 [Candidatus Limnocylindria bacterium]|nr:hypothetical protein [Candidatus Limnocylindria bacterium]
MFDNAWWRFACSGTLLGLYGGAEWWARRTGAGPDRPGVPPPRWLAPASAIALGAFYLLIGPTGSALFGGWGNATGIGLALAAIGLRLAVRNGHPRVRHPAIASRMLFYTALPLAVGVPWGWLVLTAPAYVIWAYCSQREDRVLSETVGEPYRLLMARSYRWIPGVW